MSRLRVFARFFTDEMPPPVFPSERKGSKADEETVTETGTGAPPAVKGFAAQQQLFVEGIVKMRKLRKQIQLLQHYKSLGLSTMTDVKNYETDRKRRGVVAGAGGSGT